MRWLVDARPRSANCERKIASTSQLLHSTTAVEAVAKLRHAIIDEFEYGIGPAKPTNKHATRACAPLGKMDDEAISVEAPPVEAERSREPSEEPRAREPAHASSSALTCSRARGRAHRRQFQRFASLLFID